MITYLKSNLFLSPAKVLVNTVNTEGVMGKGIAKEFKKLFPEMFIQYQEFCEQKTFNIGNLWIYKTSNKWVLNFPTKKSWRNPSRLEYIEEGLKKFVDQYLEKGIQSVAFPPLGCGNGELDWETDVRPLMEKYLKDLPIDIYIHLYTPNDIEDVPEHNHIKNIADYLQSEPNFLSFVEVLENLKHTYALTSNSELKDLKIEFLDNNDMEINHESKKTIWHYDDLLEFWSILRKHGLITRDTVPVSIADSFELLVKVFSQLPYVATTKASVNYKKLDDDLSTIAIQFLPDKKSSSVHRVAI